MNFAGSSNTETAKSSEKEGAKLERTINDLKKELSQEREKCKKLQNDLSGYSERESKMTQSMTTVSILLKSESKQFFFFSYLTLNYFNSG